MRTQEVASSVVVRFSMVAAFRVLRAGGLALLLLSTFAVFAFATSMTGCKRESRASEEVLKPPVVSDKTEGLQLTWIDEKGEFHIEQRVTDVAPGGRDVVRVVVLDPPQDAPSTDRIFLADLRQANPDGTYPVRVAPRAEFEEVAVTRRTKSGSTVLVPKVAASVAAAAPPASGASGSGTERPAVIIYGASWCGACHQAAAYLKQKGIAFVEHDIEQDSSAQHEMQAKLAKAGMRGGSIPVLDVRGRIMVGFDQRAVDQALGTSL